MVGNKKLEGAEAAAGVFDHPIYLAFLFDEQEGLVGILGSRTF